MANLGIGVILSSSYQNSEQSDEVLILTNLSLGSAVVTASQSSIDDNEFIIMNNENLLPNPISGTVIERVSKFETPEVTYQNDQIIKEGI
jgi:hypothetical protein